MSVVKKYKRPLLVLAWMAVIFTGSSIPGKDLPTGLPPDYLMHFLEYAILGAVAFSWTSKDLFKNNYRAALLFSTLFCSAYAVLDEIHQYFVPGRCMDPRDWLADTLGGLAGALALMLLFMSISGE